MRDFISNYHVLISGGLGALVVYILMAFSKSESKKDGERRILAYGRGMRIITLLCIPITGVIIYAAYASRSGQEVIAFFLAAVMLAISVFLIYQVFFVQLSYDDDTVYYKSLFAGIKQEPWTNLETIGYSHLAGSGYIRIRGIGLIWCSYMLDGHAELVEFLDKQMDRMERQ